jgi:hypothetical protein
MSDDSRRFIEIGYLPSGAENVFLAEGAADPARLMIAEASARLDAERAAKARAIAVKAADIERAKATRSARIARRFKRALKALRT